MMISLLSRVTAITTRGPVRQNKRRVSADCLVPHKNARLVHNSEKERIKEMLIYGKQGCTRYVHSKNHVSFQKYKIKISSFKFDQKEIASKDFCKQRQVTDILMINVKKVVFSATQ